MNVQITQLKIKRVCEFVCFGFTKIDLLTTSVFYIIIN